MEPIGRNFWLIGDLTLFRFMQRAIWFPLRMEHLRFTRFQPVRLGANYYILKHTRFALTFVSHISFERKVCGIFVTIIQTVYHVYWTIIDRSRVI